MNGCLSPQQLLGEWHQAQEGACPLYWDLCFRPVDSEVGKPTMPILFPPPTPFLKVKQSLQSPHDQDHIPGDGSG